MCALAEAREVGTTITAGIRNEEKIAGLAFT
jgi:hypothetical protein